MDVDSTQESSFSELAMCNGALTGQGKDPGGTHVFFGTGTATKVKVKVKLRFSAPRAGIAEIEQT